MPAQTECYFCYLAERFARKDHLPKAFCSAQSFERAARLLCQKVNLTVPLRVRVSDNLPAGWVARAENLPGINTILVRSTHLRGWVLTHEVAHFLTPGVAPPHGEAFRRAHLLVAEEFDPHWAAALRRAYGGSSRFENPERQSR